MAVNKTSPAKARRLPKVAVLALCVSLSACALNSAKKHYLLAEKLWTSGKYEEAVAEFEKVIKRDSQGSLGLKALYRAATTETIFLGRHYDALQKLQQFAEISKDEALVWATHLEIGEILFSKIRRYPEAIQHYRNLIKARPGDADVPAFLYRIGKAQFYLWKFEEAATTFRDLIHRYPQSSEAEQGLYQLGMTYFTASGRYSSEESDLSELHKKAIATFNEFLQIYPHSRLAPEAKFGIASCHAEMDHLEEAFQRFKELEKTYPSPQVIQIKLFRIKERISQRNR